MTTYNSKSEYFHGEGLPQAVRLFDELKSRKSHGVSLAMSLPQLRQKIETLPDETRLQGALADLWLDLPQKEARLRRKTAPPPSPFVKEGKTIRAAKKEIRDWDAAWRLKEAAVEAAQIFAASGAPTISRAAHILRAKLLWLVENGDVLGWIGELPEDSLTAQAAPDLSVQTWTIDDALLQPWRQPQEQALWAARFAAGNRMLESEVNARVLAAMAAAQKAKPDQAPEL